MSCGNLLSKKTCFLGLFLKALCFRLFAARDTFSADYLMLCE
jgi:hypothetical protein